MRSIIIWSALSATIISASELKPASDDIQVPAPWKVGKCIKEYCNFANPTMGDGLVLISTPANVDILNSFSPLIKSNSQSPPFEVREIPGKGIGLFANRTIQRGEIVMQYTPTLIVQFGPHIDLPSSDRESFYQDAVTHLPSPRRDAFMAQFGKDIFTKIDRNAFRMFINGQNPYSGHLGAFPEVARMNHDCRPNLNSRIENITHSSIAVRTIAVGEELTISYIDGLLPRQARQERLQDWGFECTCSLCSASAEEVEASDKRIQDIKDLEEEMDKAVGGGDLTTEMGERLVKLYREEGLETYIGHAYTKAALIYAMFGVEEKAKEYATLAADAMAMELGEEAGDVVAMRQLAERPEEHWAWEIRKPRSEEENEQVKKEQEARESVKDEL
ncbi:hypothetical protein B0T20DRAFT_109278 [Sordaria brevicollis]|uniref:SET domain-containing protein n=1 Tax=Sordaria brevicollis TaxID=83679 RepID=A0AAE0NUW8_SORBR|nr:hypothetical protein B0T20DRAFT_109278 [Sordaria brevicollis]